LFYAVVQDNAEAVQLLLKFGASLSRKVKYDGVKMTPLEFARGKKSKLLPYLLPSAAAPTPSSTSTNMQQEKKSNVLPDLPKWANLIENGDFKALQVLSFDVNETWVRFSLFWFGKSSLFIRNRV
jgi:hypothetical protein